MTCANDNFKVSASCYAGERRNVSRPSSCRARNGRDCSRGSAEAGCRDGWRKAAEALLALEKSGRVKVIPSMSASGNRLPPRNLLVLGAVLASLVALLILAVHREESITPSPIASRVPAQTARPALTAAEERYIRELWPIHGEVERGTMRMSLGQIFYKTQDLSRAERARHAGRAGAPELQLGRDPAPGPGAAVDLPRGGTQGVSRCHRPVPGIRGGGAENVQGTGRTTICWSPIRRARREATR